MSIVLSTTGKTYVLPFCRNDAGRWCPPHGFTPWSLALKQIGDNTTGTALMFMCLIPFQSRLNARIEEHIKVGEDLSQKHLAQYIQESTRCAMVALIETSARIAVQTGLAIALLRFPTPAGDATVYMWTAYPRLHQKYCGDLLESLNLPRSLSVLAGPKPQIDDLKSFDRCVPPANAFEDSMKRHVLVVTADIIVGVTLIAFESVTGAVLHPPLRGGPVVRHPASRRAATYTSPKLLIFLGRACGAAVGNSLGGGKAEYWGELVGAVFGALVGTQLICSFNLVQMERRAQ